MAGPITLATIVGDGLAGYLLAWVMQAETREESRLFRVALDEQLCTVDEAGRVALLAS